MDRRSFIKTSIVAGSGSFFSNESIRFVEGDIMTVLGPLSPGSTGFVLPHEHILVDFIGADKISRDRWNHDEVVERVMPYLLEIKSRGVRTILECTPSFLGRDVVLLQILARKTNLNLITNTGYYGAGDNKYLPEHAFSESAEELSLRWIAEFENGIEGTRVRPGFIKIGVSPGSLSVVHAKLVKAAALTHLKTGLTICAHTGPAATAEEELDILEENGVSPSAFVWVHANGSDEAFLRLGRRGCWISLDGISSSTTEKNHAKIAMLKDHHLLDRVLISHDAGWYRPGLPGGGEFRDFNDIPDRFLPFLLKNGFSQDDIRQITERNPAQAYTITVRRL